MSKVEEPLADIIKRHLNVNGFTKDWVVRLKRELTDGKHGELFKKQLRKAITNHSISPKQYEELTDEDFDTQQELDKWLLELWNSLYPNEAIIQKSKSIKK